MDSNHNTELSMQAAAIVVQAVLGRHGPELCGRHYGRWY